MEGDTDLSWDHEGLEPYPKPGEPKPLGIPNHQESLKQKQKRSRHLLKYVLNVRGTMMKGIVQNSYLKKKNKGLYLLNQ